MQVQIEELEAQIKELCEQRGQAQPRLRSTTRPRGACAPNPGFAPAEQVFEKLDHERLQASPPTDDKALYNELGVRKYDLPGAWQRFKNLFRGTGANTSHKPFVKLLAAGNIQGLKPLRYEKRIARRRFIVFAILLFIALWALIAMILRR